CAGRRHDEAIEHQLGRGRWGRNQALGTRVSACPPAGGRHVARHRQLVAAAAALRPQLPAHRGNPGRAGGRRTAAPRSAARGRNPVRAERLNEPAIAALTAARFPRRRIDPMPSALTYPGVYIEEIPSGVHTITGVATSIAAFAGWAPSGPTDHAGLVLGYADFARTYGGIDNRSGLGYAVNQFFANGGQQAYIVRLVDGTTAKAAAVTLDGKLLVTAANEGVWANDFAIVIKQSTFDATRFRLTVANWQLDPAGVPVEVFDNLSMDPADPRFVTSVLADQSAFVTAAVQGGATTPPANTFTGTPGNIPDSSKLSGGVDGTVLAPNVAAFETALLPLSGSGGLYQLDRINLFNLLCVPGETNTGVISSLETFCRTRRAFLIADCVDGATVGSLQGGPGGITGSDSINAAFYFPWVIAADPLQQNRPDAFPPCGFVAGIYARTDAARGVWKAPAGSEASLTGALGVSTVLTNAENGVLN